MDLAINERIVSLATLNQGAAIIMFDAALDKVLDNIADQNTAPDAVREVTLKIKFHPDLHRRRCEVDIKSDVKLAGHLPSSTSIYVAAKIAGKRVAVESDPNQGILFEPGDSSHAN